MRPLSDLLVLDFSTLLPGPMATLLLVEAGARVVKIEPPSGDAMRSYPPIWGKDSALFAMLNRGKESLALDLKSSDGLKQVRKLAKEADVLVEQFRPGVMARLGLGPIELAELNPRLIYCSITGYGQTGPRSNEAGHDLNFLGDTGYLALSSGDISAPVQPAAPIGDIAGGSYPAVINILLALEERRQTGRGRHIDIAMSENLFPMTYWALATGFATNEWPGNGTDLVTGSSPRYRVYATRDRKGLVVAALEEKFWSIFCARLDLDVSFRDDSVDPARTMGEIARIVIAEDAEFWTNRFSGADCCCSIMSDISHAVRDPHFVKRGVFAHTVVNERGDTMPALPIPIDPGFRHEPDVARSAPALRRALD
ncbi:CaiB/BaiF CoA transferase family protein [Microvirga antarctica]|uniref:CaiB/BaiF CoA transferase family protein n=1 Tax=Microvirga antarctica TaxID=2819233 RepID=UPI001B316F63|nr:CoA transferase [Microvirga antarctica]